MGAIESILEIHSGAGGSIIFDHIEMLVIFVIHVVRKVACTVQSLISNLTVEILLEEIYRLQDGNELDEIELMNINELDNISGSITNNTNNYHILRVPFNIEEILVCFCEILISFKLVLLVLLVVMLVVV